MDTNVLFCVKVPHGYCDVCVVEFSRSLSLDEGGERDDVFASTPEADTAVRTQQQVLKESKSPIVTSAQKPQIKVDSPPHKFDLGTSSKASSPSSESLKTTTTAKKEQQQVTISFFFLPL